MLKRLSSFRGLLSAFAVSALIMLQSHDAFSCLLTQAEFENLPEISLGVVLKTPNYLIFRGVVYDMNQISETAMVGHARRFRVIKASESSVISEETFNSHPNGALKTFLSKAKNAAGRLEGVTYSSDEVGQ